jgi:peptide/nickel transport system substrate-binding protein
MPGIRAVVSTTVLSVIVLAAVSLATAQSSLSPAEEVLKSGNVNGTHGGQLVVALRSEPGTLNPVFASDASAHTVIWRMMADLLHINRENQEAEPALAKSWKVSADGLQYTLQLRRDLRFSDGHSLDADDVLFSFRVYLDEKVNSPQRSLLLLDEKPIVVTKTGSLTVVFTLPAPYAAVERLFDGFAILPRHLLETAYREGRLNQSWNTNTQPDKIAGLGPFRLKEYRPGDRLVLERNPYYWKVDGQGDRLPYLDRIVFLFVANADAQVIRFQAGDTDVVSLSSAENYAVLTREQKTRGYTLHDLGASLEHNFLFFNLNNLKAKNLPATSSKQRWFADVTFRQAVSAAIDRSALTRLVYRNRATALITHVTPGNKLWRDESLPTPPRSLERARSLLRSAGYSWNSEGVLLDDRGQEIQFSIITPASNAQRTRMATIIQDDLKQLGMRVQVVSLEFRAYAQRITGSLDYEACILGLGGTDIDPNSEIGVLLSDGGSHFWSMAPGSPLPAWQEEIDRLMHRQLSTLDPKKRKQLYNQVQRLVAENLPFISLVSPNTLVGAKNALGNFRPAILIHHTLWNAEELFWKTQDSQSQE